MLGAPQKAQLHFNVEEPPGSGVICAMSDPLDDYADYLGLWYAIINQMMNPAKLDVTKKQWIETISPTEFKIHMLVPDWILLPYGYDDLRPDSTADVDLQKTVIHDKRNGIIKTAMTTDLNREIVLQQDNFVIHKDPLKVQFWTVFNVRRGVGRHLAYWIDDKLTRTCIHADIQHVKVYPNYLSPDTNLRSVFTEPIKLPFAKFWALFKKEMFGKTPFDLHVDIEFDKEDPENKWKIIRHIDGNLQNANTAGYHPIGMELHGQFQRFMEVHVFDPPTENKKSAGLYSEFYQGHGYKTRFTDPQYKMLHKQFMVFHVFDDHMRIEAFREWPMRRLGHDPQYGCRTVLFPAIDSQAKYFSHDALIADKN